MSQLELYFEALFWVGAITTATSFFLKEWFLFTVLTGLSLMIISVIIESFRIHRTNDLTNDVMSFAEQNTLQILHICLIFLAILFIFAFLKNNLETLNNIQEQFTTLMHSPASSIWWVIVALVTILGIILITYFTIPLEQREKIKNGIKEKIKNQKYPAETKPTVLSRALQKFQEILEKHPEEFKEEKIINQKTNEKILNKTLKIEKKQEIKKTKLKLTISYKLLISVLMLLLTALLILNSKGMFSFRRWYVSLIFGAALGIFFLLTVMIIKPMKKQEKTLEKKMIKEIKREFVIRKGDYKTDIDKLYEIIQQKGKITVKEASEGFKIPKETIEEWAKILDGHDLIRINYPAMGEMELCKK